MKRSQRKRLNEIYSEATKTTDTQVMLERMDELGLDGNRILDERFTRHRKRKTKMLSEELRELNRSGRKRNGRKSGRHSGSRCTKN